MVSLEQFATSQHAQTVRDTCGEPLIILGRPPRVKPEECCHIYDHGNGKYCVVLLFDRELLWTNAKKRLLGKGFTLSQDGETEGVLLFDPTNDEQVRLAFKAARVRKVKQYSPERLAALSANAKNMRAARLQDLEQEETAEQVSE